MSGRGKSTYVWREVIGGLAVSHRSRVWPVPFLGVVAKIGLQGKTRECEQRRDDGRLV